MRSIWWFFLVILGASPPASSEEFLGLIELPQFFGSENADSPGGVAFAAVVKPLRIYARATSDSEILAIIDDPQAIEAREFAYELLGGIVYDMHDDWYLLGYSAHQTRQKGWVHAAAVKRFLEFDALLTRSLTYLTDHWNGELWAHPAQAGATRFAGNVSSTNVLDTRKVNDTWWVRIELLSGEHCRAAEIARIAEGWVPVFSAAGDLNIWFRSRGC